MKKTLCILLTLMLLLLAVGCQYVNESSEQPKEGTSWDESDNIVHDTTGLSTPDTSISPEFNENEPGIGGVNSLDRNFIDEVYGTISILVAVGQEAFDYYNEEVYPKIPVEERDNTPDLYKALQYFNISKEDYLVALEESKQKYGTKIEPWMVDALYAEDMNTMLEALARPTALYHDGVIYTPYDMAEMSSETCVELGISAEKLNTYVEQLVDAGLDMWEKDYFNPIDALAESVASLTVVTPEHEVE